MYQHVLFIPFVDCVCVSIKKNDITRFKMSVSVQTAELSKKKSKKLKKLRSIQKYSPIFLWDDRSSTNTS